MDSMRSLNSSLPSSRPSRSAPPEQLLQAFRTAALSVTNLYKSAATEEHNARQSGYQEALEDLLKFLDKENLGLQDGEGWRIRQWATGRYDGGVGHQEMSETDEPEAEAEVEAESRSRGTSQEEEDSSDSRNQETAQAISVKDEDKHLTSTSKQTIFRFAANSQLDSNMQTDDTNTPQHNEEQASSSSSNTPIRVEFLNRNGRLGQKTHNTRQSIRSSPREFTFTAGTKRKVQFPDFFDISNINEKRDGLGGGGSKRGRLI